MEEQNQSPLTTEGFLEYWDKEMEYWVKHGKMSQQEEKLWKDVNPDICPELMPGPYQGDPENCSIVILNYNPGRPSAYDKNKDSCNDDPVHHSRLNDPKSMCFHYAHDYRKKMKQGGYLGQGRTDLYDSTGLTQEGKCWWCKRLQWFKELLTDSSKLPFSLELCGWHSKSWHNLPAKKSKEILTTLRHRLSGVIEESISKSELGVGICVGKQWGDLILPAFGYKDVSAEFPTPSGMIGDKDTERHYRVMRKENVQGNDIYIINTWLSKGYQKMNVPSPKFRDYERRLIQAIKDCKK